MEPGKVVLGLGWYGRSFTLTNPSCNKPWCEFTSGGEAGKCSGTSGVLTNAGTLNILSMVSNTDHSLEINRIIKSNNLKPSFDATAAVKWITWSSDQWVSYDDGQTTQLKIQYASKRVSTIPCRAI